MRIVPASTSRRNPATMSGTRMSTAAGIATTRSHWGIIDTSQQRGTADTGGGAHIRHHAAIAARVHIFNAEPVTSTDPSASNPVLRAQRGEQLHDLSIHFRG